MDEEGLPFPTGPARDRFALRRLELAPGELHPYVAAEWRGALVVVAQGDIELETSSGACWHFREGEMLWLEGLPVTALRSPGPAATLLLTVSRRRR